jgi:hypothetical protein
MMACARSDRAPVVIAGAAAQQRERFGHVRRELAQLPSRRPDLQPPRRATRTVSLIHPPASSGSSREPAGHSTCAGPHHSACNRYNVCDSATMRATDVCSLGVVTARASSPGCSAFGDAAALVIPHSLRIGAVCRRGRPGRPDVGGAHHVSRVGRRPHRPFGGVRRRRWRNYK